MAKSGAGTTTAGTGAAAAASAVGGIRVGGGRTMADFGAGADMGTFGRDRRMSDFGGGRRMADFGSGRRMNDFAEADAPGDPESIRAGDTSVRGLRRTMRRAFGAIPAIALTAGLLVGGAGDGVERGGRATVRGLTDPVACSILLGNGQHRAEATWWSEAFEVCTTPDARAATSGARAADRRRTHGDAPAVAVLGVSYRREPVPASSGHGDVKGRTVAANEPLTEGAHNNVAATATTSFDGQLASEQAGSVVRCAAAIADLVDDAGDARQLVEPSDPYLDLHAVDLAWNGGNLDIVVSMADVRDASELPSAGGLGEHIKITFQLDGHRVEVTARFNTILGQQFTVTQDGTSRAVVGEFDAEGNTVRMSLPADEDLGIRQGATVSALEAAASHDLVTEPAVVTDAAAGMTSACALA